MRELAKQRMSVAGKTKVRPNDLTIGKTLWKYFHRVKSRDQVSKQIVGVELFYLFYVLIDSFIRKKVRVDNKNIKKNTELLEQEGVLND